MGGLLGKNVGLGVVVCFSGKAAGGKRRYVAGSTWERGPRVRDGGNAAVGRQKWGNGGRCEGWGKPVRAGPCG